MSWRFRNLGVIALLGATLVLSAQAQAATGPLYDVKATWGDTNLKPGDSSPFTAEGQFVIQVSNIGDETGKAELIVADKLPVGVFVISIHWSRKQGGTDYSGLCSGQGSKEVACKMPAGLLPELAPAPGAEKGVASPEPSGYMPPIYVDVSVSAKASGEGTNMATIEGGGAPAPASDVDQVTFNSTPASFGIVPGSFFADVFTDAHPFGESARQASDRPFELRFNFDIAARTGVNNGSEGDTSRYITSSGQLRTVEFTLPRGMIGNPEATPKCDPADFAELGATLSSTACPANTQVGYLRGLIANGTRDYGRSGLGPIPNALANRVAIYNLEPPKGVLADLGFTAGGFVQGHAYGELDPAQDYAIKVVAPNISNLVTVRGSESTTWGVPGDPAHDKFRFFAKVEEGKDVLGATWGSEPIRPFLTNPMDCGEDNGGARVRIDSYNHPGQFTPVQEYGKPLNVEGCEDPRFRFEPEIALQPTSADAGGPTGLDLHLEVPQRNDVVGEAKELYATNGNVKAIATPPMKRAVVTLPEGMTISPSAAQGLAACTQAQIGLGTNSKVTCPDASQYGTLTLHTPALPTDEQPKGFVYIAKQDDNPFHSFLALYLVIQEPKRGLLVKLPGRVELDPDSGQIKSTFDDLPQFPVSDFQLTLKGGVRAGLVNPSTCGQKTIRAEFFSWQDPKAPHVVTDSYEVTRKPDGSPCVHSLSERPFAPDLVAGTLDNIAGAYTSFLFRLSRTDDDQEFSQLGVALPPGLVPKIAGVSECPEAGIAQAEALGRSGAEEQLFPSCPSSSLIGTTNAEVGVGVPLTYVPGKVYLAGPYRGAPLSVVVITPAVVGPFDVGVIAVRAAAYVNPETTQATVSSDPFPLIFKGIPVRLRDIRVKVDRPEFMRNPTNCKELSIAAHVTGTGGDLKSTADDTAAELSEHFQAAECASLPFKPKLSFRLFGGTNRGSHPKLRAVLRMPKGNANIARASVALPRSEFIDQGHIRTVCTRVQFAQDACPAGAIYGHATAKTPLLDEPLSGTAYLRSSSNELPDLVMAFKGKVDVDVVGRIDSVRGGLRTTFESVPDVPVSSFMLTMEGGRKGLFVNSRNLCKSTARATAQFNAQNGRRTNLRPVMTNSCEKQGQKSAKHARRHYAHP